MSAARVSIIIPAYQPRVEWLQVAVASALQQRAVDVEVVVVDDGSREEVEPLLAGFEPRRLRVVRVPHGGVSAARNAGLAAATGSHVRFLDADDVAEPGSTARLLALSQGVDGIGYGATAMCDEALRVHWVMRARQQGWAAIDGMLGRFHVRPQSLVLPRELLDVIGPWDTSLTVSEDWDYIQRALERAPVRGEQVIATFYRRHPQSATADVQAGLDAAELIVGRCFERHPEWRTPALKRRAAAMLAGRRARILLTHRGWHAAAPHVVRAARAHPGALLHEARTGMSALAESAGRRLRGHDERPVRAGRER